MACRYGSKWTGQFLDELAGCDLVAFGLDFPFIEELPLQATENKGSGLVEL